MTRLLLACVLTAVAAHAQDTPPRHLDGIDPWFGTFSIIAFDRA